MANSHVSDPLMLDMIQILISVTVMASQRRRTKQILILFYFTFCKK
ncbi:hypothetical protein BVRB_4g096470 [Beta vulgaris subsp. vulgaris]|uniref:Uncharacterized protein n=1 Tax=Beta vulgaris subsp. vulgaris TaxID=3555 RepID=A0A0J8B9Q6_BETVV|nr:hypothetical protein BVRB_4g096470 [Beta vulgaris subsp. vulgaris]